MADEGAKDKEVFRRSTMNRIESADELDHYIKVTNPSAWVIALAALLLVAGIIIWAFVAVVPVTVNTTGFTIEGLNDTDTIVVCWVDKQTQEKIVNTGVKASVDGVEAKSVTIDSTPMSASEVISLLGSDFYVSSLNLSDWNYAVTIDPGDEPRHTDYTITTTSIGESHLVPVSLVVTETQPINIVLGNE